MIEAMRILVKKKKMDIQMKLVGKGKDSEFIHGLIDQYELSPYIEVMNQLSDEALNGMMKKAAFVLYLPICEPFGLVPLEAMGVGTPVIVSNHGGRVLDHTPGVAEVLRETADAVKGQIEVLADGGIRSGGDVLKMVALGADAVLIGRPFSVAAMGGLKEGVRAYIAALREELQQAMVLTGCPDIREADGTLLR